MSELEVDLNATIASAINAKVEAGVLAALSGDEVLGRYVTAALNQEVQVGTSSYDRKRTTFIHKVILDVVKAAVERAARNLLAEDEVRKALRRQAPEIANQLVGNLAERSKNGYGVRVELQFPNSF